MGQRFRGVLGSGGQGSPFVGCRAPRAYFCVGGRACTHRERLSWQAGRHIDEPASWSSARTIRRTVRVLPLNVRRHGFPSATQKNTAENPRATNNHALRNSEPGRSVLTSLAETSTPPNRRRCGGSGASMTSGMRPSRSARPAPSSRNVAGARQARRSRRWRGRSIIRDASITRCVDCSPRARPGELSRPPSSPL